MQTNALPSSPFRLLQATGSPSRCQPKPRNGKSYFIPLSPGSASSTCDTASICFPDMHVCIISFHTWLSRAAFEGPPPLCTPVLLSTYTLFPCQSAQLPIAFTTHFPHSTIAILWSEGYPIPYIRPKHLLLSSSLRRERVDSQAGKSISSTEDGAFGALLRRFNVSNLWKDTTLVQRRASYKK
jgi:hypothetical protein